MIRALAGAAAGILLALACPTASRAEGLLSIGKVYLSTQGWTVGRNENVGGCLAATSDRDGTTVWAGFDVEGEGVLAFTNARWRSIEPGARYEIEMRAHGGRSWKGTFTGVERKDEKGIVATSVKLSFLEDFARAGGIGISVDGRPITQLSLRGSGVAGDAVAACQQSIGRQAAAGDTNDAARTSKKKPSEPGESSGTGFFVSSAGHVMTNNHVVKSCSAIAVTPPGGITHTATLVAHDEKNDLAILLSDIKPLAVPGFNPRARVGEQVSVFGYPLTGLLATTGNFTVGNVTATAGINDDTNMLQISAPVQPGNSGGPVFDQNGNVAGVIVSKLNALRIANITDDVPQNVNFAIKGSIALNFMDSNSIAANGSPRTDKLDPTAIADFAKVVTLKVSCR